MRQFAGKFLYIGLILPFSVVMFFSAKEQKGIEIEFTDF